ncbi:hypothetical protein, partial [Rhizobium sp. BK376]|uniref:hypothetical protein n=1 Tax=Rhizobium sp. BK376 TaxID=2512149 RepID=UPI0010E02AA8
AKPITRYSATRSARALGFAISRQLHHLLGHDPGVLRKIMMERGIVGKDDEKTPDNKVVCSVADIERAVSDHRARLDFQAILPILGVSKGTALRSVASGVLHPAFGVAKGMRAKFTRASVDALLRNLIGKAETREEDDNIVSLENARAKARCQIADIIRALIDGRIVTRYVSMDPSKVGLARILVDSADVKAIFPRPSRGLTLVHFSKAV